MISAIQVGSEPAENAGNRLATVYAYYRLALENALISADLDVNTDRRSGIDGTMRANIGPNIDEARYQRETDPLSSLPNFEGILSHHWVSPKPGTTSLSSSRDESGTAF